MRPDSPTSIFDSNSIQEPLEEWNWKVPQYYSSKRTTRNAKKFLTARGTLVSLHTAAETEAISDIEFVIRNNPDCNIDQTDRRGLTALHLAVRRGNFSACQSLIKNNANILQETKSSKSNIIHCAAASGNIKILQELFAIISLRFGKDTLQDLILSNNNHGKLPAHCAAQSGNTKVFDLLYSQDPAFHRYNKTNDGRTFSLLAAERGHYKMVMHLYKMNQVPKESLTNLYHNIVHHAARSGNCVLLKFVVRKMREHNKEPFKPNVLGQTPIFAAAESQFIQVVDYLLQPGQDLSLNLLLPNTCTTPLSKAAQSGSLEMVKHLISRGANVKVSCAKPLLHFAAKGGNVDVFKWLLEHQSLSDELEIVSRTVGKYHKNLFHYAVECGNGAMIKYLCEEILPKHKKLKDLLMCDGTSPIEIACDVGNFDAVQYLIEKKLFKCPINDLLICAVSARYLDIVQLLLGELFPIGSSVRPPTSLLNRLAIWCNDIDFLKLEILQQRNYSINDGKSVLFEALRNDNSDLVHMILTDKEIKISMDFEYTKHLLHAAALGGNLETAKLLVNIIPAVKKYTNEKYHSSIGDVYPLHLAVVTSNFELVKFFVEEVLCDVKSASDNRLTALHLASACCSHRSQIPIIEYLIRAPSGYECLLAKVHTFPNVIGTDLTPHDVASSNEVRLLLEKYSLNKLAERFLVPKEEIDYDICSRLGAGYNAPVYRGTYRLTSVAVKIMVRTPNTPLYMLMQEVGIMAAVRHKNLCALEAVSIEDDKVCLVMEQMETSLKEYVKKLNISKEQFPLPLLKSIGIDICLGMNALHSNNPLICHLDLKLANILLNKYNEAKIADFGISKFDYMKESKAVYEHILPPEYQQKEQFTPLVDIYAFGLCLINMMACNPNRLDLKNNYYFATNLVSFNSFVSNDFLNIVRKCCAWNPEKRYQSFSEIIPELRKVKMFSEEGKFHESSLAAEDNIPNILIPEKLESELHNSQLPLNPQHDLPILNGNRNDGGYVSPLTSGYVENNIFQ